MSITDSRMDMVDHRTPYDEAPLSTVRYGYDRWAASYDDADPSTLLDEPVIVSLAHPLEGCRILDLGCGTGRYLRQCQGHGRCIGLDISRGMLSRARAHIRNNTTSWIQASVESLPFQPAVFDRVLCGLVADHVNDLPRFFREMAAVLKVGGRAVVSAVHPQMQRLTGATVAFTTGKQPCRIAGVIHEVRDIVEAASSAGLGLVEKREPCVNAEVVFHRPEWRSRLGCPALLIVALKKEALPDHVTRRSPGRVE